VLYQDDLKILVLEDSPSAMFDIVSKLSRFVHQDSIIKAFDYEEAIDAMNSNYVSLIFSDLSMPKKNGMDFIVDFLSSKSEFKSIPVVVTTSVSTESFLKKALDGKVYRYLEKPIHPQFLQEVFCSLSSGSLIN